MEIVYCVLFTLLGLVIMLAGLIMYQVIKSIKEDIEEEYEPLDSDM